MISRISFSPGQRAILVVAAAAGGLGLNGVFLYYACWRITELYAALSHPVAAVLMIEAFIVTALGAFLMARYPLGRWGWKSFVLFSLAGGLAFSIPLILLLNENRNPSR